MEESLLKLKLTEDDGANSFMNLLVVNCFNTLLTLFNYQTLKNDDDSNANELTTTTSNDPNRRRASDVLARLLRDYRNQKSVCLKSIKRDYRFINLLCLYRQAELNIEHSMSSTTTPATSKKLLVNEESLLFNHFSDSLGSMRNTLKAFIDENLETWWWWAAQRNDFFSFCWTYSNKTSFFFFFFIFMLKQKVFFLYFFECVFENTFQMFSILYAIFFYFILKI